MEFMTNNHLVYFEHQDGHPWPENILIDGKPCSTRAMVKEHGFCWGTSASGNNVYYAADDGSKIGAAYVFQIEQKRFQKAEYEEKMKKAEIAATSCNS